MFQILHRTILRKATWSVLGVLLVAALFAPAVLAANPGPPNFEALRTDIGRTVPEEYQPSFLAKVDAAEQLHPPNPCAASNVLTALRNENQAVSGTNGYLVEDAAIIDAGITELQDMIVPPNPC
jgi:hypothetical protein